jgi:hypothetical protein
VVGTDLGSAHRAVIADLLEDGHGDASVAIGGGTTGATWHREASSKAAPLRNTSLRRSIGQHRGAVPSPRATEKRLPSKRINPARAGGAA